MPDEALLEIDVNSAELSSVPADFNLTKERALAAGLSEFEFEQLVKPVETAKAADFRDLKIAGAKRILNDCPAVN